ncbi:hypothetical protein E4U17_001867, partial [Claviceps sp. LM77 group G4]
PVYKWRQVKAWSIEQLLPLPPTATALPRPYCNLIFRAENAKSDTAAVVDQAEWDDSDVIGRDKWEAPSGR